MCHLAPRRHGGGGQEACAVASVIAELDVLGDLRGHKVAPVRSNRGFAFGAGLFERLPAVKGDRVARAIRTVVGGQCNRRVEQHSASHEFGRERHERQCEQTSE